MLSELQDTEVHMQQKLIQKETGQDADNSYHYVERLKMIAIFFFISVFQIFYDEHFQVLQ